MYIIHHSVVCFVLFYFYTLYNFTLKDDELCIKKYDGIAKSVYQDETAPEGAVSSGFTLFA